MPDIWRYALRHDNGMAPCVYGDILTLACCKPLIRRHAKAGDWVIGFVSKPVSGSVPKIAWVGKVDAAHTLGDYYVQYGTRPDALYKRKGWKLDGSEELVRATETSYHRGIERRDWSGKNALVFRRFWYWGNNSNTVPPQEIADLIHPFVGQTKKNSTPERIAALETWLGTLGPAGIYGTPRDRVVL